MNNILSLNNEINRNNNLEEAQNKFLESNLGKTINTAIDVGLRWVLPDFIENEVIDVKNALVSGGLKNGINQAINSAINLGKSAIGIITGNFESISQAQSAIKSGGIIDSISNVLDNVLKKVTSSGKLTNNISNLIKNGKDVILNNISKNIENSFNTQLDAIGQLNKYENNWKEFFKNKDYTGMVKEYKKINKKIKELMPIEETIKQARIIENIQSIIKNNNGSFTLTNEQMELAKLLT